MDEAGVEGARFLALVRWAKEGECSSVYFCRIERKRGQDRLITGLRGSDGSDKAVLEGVSSILSDLYLSLFSKKRGIHLCRKCFCPKFRIGSRWIAFLIARVCLWLKSV